MEVRRSLTRTLLPSEKRRRQWQQKKGSSFDSVVWPIRTRTRVFLPFFSWTDVPPVQLEQVIGSGKFSCVRIGRHRRSSGRRFSLGDVDDSVMAVKVIDKSVILSEAGLGNQLNQETRIHQVCCHHSNILNMFKAWQDEHHLYMAYELCQQGTLHGLWLSMKRPFPTGAVSLAACQVSSALEYIHTVGVIHRDVKLENILISGSGNLLLADFGLAMWLGSQQKTTSICGTLAYMAPEVLNASTSAPYGHKADFWSLGVTCHALRFHRLPFTKGSDHHRMLENVRQEYPSVIAAVDDAEIRSLLAYDASDRRPVDGSHSSMSFMQLATAHVQLPPASSAL